MANIRAVLFDAGNTLIWLDHPYAGPCDRATLPADQPRELHDAARESPNSWCSTRRW